MTMEAMGREAERSSGRDISSRAGYHQHDGANCATASKDPEPITVFQSTGRKQEDERMTTQDSPSLYDRLGGVYGIATVVDNFIDRIMVDPRLNANPRVDVG